MKKEIIIPTGRDKNILADISYKNSSYNKPMVIFCHGYKGYKDWGCWNLVAEEFIEQGFVFLKFNFSYNGGTIEQPIDFPDLDAFGNNTYSKELEDLHTVINWSVSNNNIAIDKNNITIIGHSRGGGIASIVAKENIFVSKLVTLASVSNFKKRFPKQEKLKEWKKNNVFYVKNGRTKQNMPHFFSFYQDFIDNEQRLTIKNSIKNINKPYFIVHGDNDEAVSINEAEQLKKWSLNSKYLIIKNGNHTFDSKHPWGKEELPKTLKYVINKIIEFILEE